MKVVMLNDRPWAGSSRHPGDAGDEALKKLGEEECRQRGWLPVCDWKRGSLPPSTPVHVSVVEVLDVSARRPK